MAEDTTTTASVAAPAVEAAPIAVVAPTPEVSAPVVESAPITEAAPVVKADAPVVEAAKPLLGPEADKSDAPKAEGEKPVEAEKTEAQPLPVYEFKLPEGANAESPVFKAFQAKLGEFQNLSKTDQAVVNKLGQDMIDMHLEGVKDIVENQNKASWDWFNNRNKEWLESAKKDPVIGGDNFDSTVNAASQAVSLYGGSKAQQIETAKLLQTTGLENSPIMLRFLSNITKVAAKEGTPVGGSNTPLQPKFNPAQALFGGEKKSA